VGREVFVDAGAWIAISDTRDKYHKAATKLYRCLLEERRILVTTNLVIAEACIIIRRMGGHRIAMRFLHSIRHSARLTKIYSDTYLEAEAEKILEEYEDHDFSLVDAVGFAVMSKRGIEESFAFDRHFIKVGFYMLHDGSIL
jgi:predicted nucleic acid-binding protein